MDDVVRKALKKLRDLQSEVADIEKFLATYEALSGTKVARDDMLSVGSVAVKSPAQSTERVTPAHTRRHRKLSPQKLVPVIKSVLKEVGRPLTRGQIAEELERRDIKLTSPNKAKYVGTIIWRNSDVFRNIDGEGYWLVDEPVPSSFTDPNPFNDVRPA